MVTVPPSALAALSAAVLLLVIDHRRANLGGRAAAAFFFASAGYGLIRSLSIRTLAEAHLGGMPYRLGSPLASIAGVPLQELVGWTASAGLAAYFADRLLRRFGRPTDPYRTTLIAGFVMAGICLAVESAAVAGGWWSWSLAHSPDGAINFPAIALLDWGFVAIDFLLPFELWRRGASLFARLAGLLCFPIHLAGHAFAAPWPGPIPLSGFDFVHVGLAAAVAAAAMTMKPAEDASAWPSLRAEPLRFRPVLATSILLGTAAVQLVLAREAGRLWTALPLAALALFVAASRKEVPAKGKPWPRARAAALFAILLAFGLALRLPSALAARAFETHLRQGAASAVAGRLDDAATALQEALALRPGHSEALWLLGWVEMQQGNRAPARAHLEAALAARPGALDAVRLLARLDLEEGKKEEAAALLAQAIALHPDREDLGYLAWKAKDASFGTEPAPAALLAAASPSELGEIFALARALGDRKTEEACRALAGSVRVE